MKLDEKDKAILDILTSDAKTSISKISKQINMPTTTIHNRIKRMEKNNVIINYTININKKILFGEIIAFVLLQISKGDQKEVVKELIQHKQVEEVSIITGENDIILRLRITSIDKLNQFILDNLRQIPGISNSTTMIALDFREK